MIEEVQQKHEKRNTLARFVNSNHSDLLGGIAVNWYIFGYNNHTRYQPWPLTFRFQRRESGVNQHVKTFVNIDQYEKPADSPHSFEYLNNASVIDTKGVALSEPTYFHPNGPTDMAVIHHIWTKSLEEYRSRCKRGRATTTKKEHILTQPYCKSEEEALQFFQTIHPYEAMVEDDSAWKFLAEGMPEKYGKIDQSH